MQSRFLQRALAARPNGDAATLEPAVVPMAFAQVKQRMAFAAYDESCSRIVLEDVFVGEEETHDVAQRIISSIRPSLLLLPAATIRDSDLLESLTTAPFEATTNDDDPEQEEGNENTATPPQQTIPYRMMKSSNYEIRSCKRRIMKLRVESLKRQAPRAEPSRNDGTDRHFPLQDAGDRVYNVSYFHALSSVIDFESVAQVQSLGALLAFLRESDANFDETGIMTVNQIVRTNSSMYVSLSTEAISALQIFSTEHHPLVATKQDGNSKEGHSLFSLLDRTCSLAGRQLLKEWMLKPLRHVGEITARQDGVELFMLPDVQNSVGAIYRLMGKIGAVQKIVARIQKCTSKPNDYLVLLRSLSAAVAIVDTLHDEILWKVRVRAGPEPDDDALDERNPQALAYLDFLEMLLEQCEPDKLHVLFEMMLSIVDEEATEESKGRLLIREGYSELLDSQKQRYARLEETLISCTAAIEETYPHLAGLINLVFFPQIGFLIGVGDQLDWRSGGLSNDFEFMFQEGDRSYFKCNETRELDEDIGDLYSAIKDTEAMIVSELEERILDCTNELQTTYQALAELDCILSFANIATDLHYVRPEVVPESHDCIEIVNGRHPLQEFLVQGDFIANDTSLDQTDRVAVVTGPNFSGKSCYARQVGILVYMAQLGCFIPCEVACISVVDQILARFSCIETCSIPQSTFQLELTQMGAVLRKATSRSLIIVDEFGKGTSPASGISLLTATLKRLCQIRCKVVCTTHFLEVFSTGQIEDGKQGMKALRMSVKIPKDRKDMALPLFKLEHGIANSSAGILCAKMAGVDGKVIDRANEIVSASKNQRQVRPKAGILRGDPEHVELQIELAQDLAEVDWSSASERQIDLFRYKVEKLRLKLQM